MERGVKREGQGVPQARPAQMPDIDDADGEVYGAAAGDLFGSNKRQKTDVYPRGTIKQVKVHDFMTYSGTVVIKPGARLNLVLGPNGTGKSSFVCAICIGLNGSPKTLGRADNLKDFVRRGQQMFWTEITLSSGGSGRDFVVKRTVTLQRETGEDGKAKYTYKTVWHINGVEKPQKDVDKLVKELNLQFDNLCQFLPQDKVVEFARMDKYELLAATEKAIGDSTTYDQHQKLIELRKEERTKEQERDSLQNKIVKLEAEQQVLQREYDRFQQKAKLLQEARSLDCQSKWLAVAAKSEEVQELKATWNKAQAEFNEVNAQQQDDDRPLQAKQSEYQALLQRKSTLAAQNRQAESTSAGLVAAVNNQRAAVEDARTRLEGVVSESNRRLQDIDQACSKVRALQERVNALPDLKEETEGLTARINDADARMREFKAQYDEAQANSGEMQQAKVQIMQDVNRIQEQLRRLQDSRQRVASQLYYKTRGLQEVVQWLNEHRDEFQGPVYGPIGLELNIATDGVVGEHALQYVENICFAWLTSFIVTTRHDEERLHSEINKAARANPALKGCKVVCSNYQDDQPLHINHPDGEASSHERFGIVATVDQLFDAPPIIKSLLVQQCGINRTYIGTAERTQPMIEQIANETTISSVLTPGSRQRVIRSSYDASTRHIEMGHLYQPSYLSASSPQEDERRASLVQESHRLHQAMQGVEAKAAAQEAQLSTLAQQLNQAEYEKRQAGDQLNRIRNNRRIANAELRNAQTALSMKEQMPDPLERKPELEQALKGSLGALATTGMKLLKALQHTWATTRMVIEADLSVNHCKAQLDALQELRTHRLQAVTAARQRADAAKAQCDSARQRLKEMREQAQADYEVSPEECAEIKCKQSAGVKAIDVAKEAELKRAEADELVCNDAQAKKFQERQAQISNLRMELEALEAYLQELHNGIEAIRGVWLPTIETMVATVNESFSTNFKDIGCAGEVRLKEDADYDKFAIEILVKFRADEEMQLLTASRQSGGERSVSTILYLIALQNVTSTPFRVVDEINQGMDPINERTVFRQLVTASTAEGTPQCFLLTPKLLPDLEYSKDITLMIIENGCHIQDGLTKSFNMAEGFFGQRYHSVAAH